MATSLAEQLQSLTLPQSSVYEDNKKKPSLLFDPKEAASKDRDTFYEIGLSGLKELIAVSEKFRVYENSLFGLASKDFERAVQTAEKNKALDKNIVEFLLNLSPYLLLESSHKCLEWLINRFSIHQYNQDEIMMVILPYHESKLFVRLIQIMNFKKRKNKWHWLEPLQKPGIHLARQVLYNHCGSDPATLKFITAMISSYVKIFNEQANQLATVFAFFCSCVIGSLESVKEITESHINAILPSLMKALDSDVNDYRQSSYIILGYVASRSQFKLEIINNVLVKLFTVDYESVLLVNILAAHQENFNIFPIEIIYDISSDVMHRICNQLGKLIDKKIDVMPFVTKLLTSLLLHIQENIEDFKRLCGLPEMILEELDLKTQKPDAVIRCLMDSFEPSQYKDEGGYESDLEIIEDSNLVSNEIITHELCVKWYSELLKRLETKYPASFDNVIQEVIKSKKISSKRQEQLSTILGFKSAISHKIGDTYLFEKINHTLPQMRIEAANYINRNFTTLKNVDQTFLKDALICRFDDDDPGVVTALLKIPLSWLEDILTADELTNIFTCILRKNTRQEKWLLVILEAVEAFQSSESVLLHTNTFLTIFPFMFPKTNIQRDIFNKILSSVWAHKFGFISMINNIIKKLKLGEKENAVICETVFTVFESGKWHYSEINEEIEVNNLNDPTKTLLQILILVCKLEDVNTDCVNKLLVNFLNVIDSNEIILTEENDLSGALMPMCLKNFRQNKIIFPFVDFIFEKIVDFCEFEEGPNPWNICSNKSDRTLLSKLYEIFLTGCALPSYSKPYALLLKKLLEKNCPQLKDKIQFCSYFACGNIYKTDEENQVIKSELQLRSLKLIYELLKMCDDISWVYESTLCYSILFALSSPSEIIRTSAINVLSVILTMDKEGKHSFKVLFQELSIRKDQIILDSEQISLILFPLLCQEKSARKSAQQILNPMNSCLNYILETMTDNKTPNHVSLELLKLLRFHNDSDFLRHVIPLGIKNLASDKCLDIYDSNILNNIIKRININSVEAFEHKDVWHFVTMCLSCFIKIVVSDKLNLISPCELMLKQIDNDCFSLLSELRRTEVIKLICMAGTVTRDTRITSQASKMVKKLDFRFKYFKSILDNMLTVKDPVPVKQKKRASTFAMLSHQTAETDEWKCGITLLEYLQNNKRLPFEGGCISFLFKLLERCLEFEEQSYVEYTKQLLLSIVLNYCKKVDKKTDLKALKSLFDIETVVKCIRGTQNPQTHHHALMLLSHAASLMPDQVLTHIMAIFTFIGSSVLRHDDQYSFQIIIKIIETIIPILVQVKQPLQEHSEKDVRELQSRVVPVLRIFAEVVLDVPEHRRLPLYKKLMDTLQPSSFLWVMLALLLEGHINHFSENKTPLSVKPKSLLSAEQPITRIDFAHLLLMEYSPEIILESHIKLILYAKSLPMQKNEDSMETDIDPGEIFSTSSHSAVQLRHFRYTIITFMNLVLSAGSFKQHMFTTSSLEVLAKHYKTFIVNILVFITFVSKATDDTAAKYWKVMLHHSYDLLDNVNNLLSTPMFVSVVRGLLTHNLQTVRRKAMDLLNSKIQFSSDAFQECDREQLFSLLPALMTIVETIEDPGKNGAASVEHEIELNQQTALLSLKLLTRMLASANPIAFKPVLEKITCYICNPNGIPGNIMASIVLCLAELCTNLKAHTLSYLPKFMPALIKILKKQRQVETPELILLSTITAVCKVVEYLPLFLSPYLKKIIYEYAILMTKWQEMDQECTKVIAVMSKLSNIKSKIATSIAPRILVPVVSETCSYIVSKGQISAIAPVVSILADNFATITNSDFTSLQQELSQFFLHTLQLRCDFDLPVIPRVEDEVINSLVCLVLKLSESSFRPFYFKIYDSAIRTNINNAKDRTITFYRLTHALADRLKGLFVLFAGHFIQNAAELLDECNNSKATSLYFDTDIKCEVLVENILQTLRIVFLYDSQNFLNKERFEILMQAIVDQLENTVGGLSALQERVKQLINPCISQLAVTIADDSLWKPLNYQILLKMRHSVAEIRLLALDCFVSVATKLGPNWLPLLAESVPFLAELLEDGDSGVEEATKDAIRNLELILGESLQKYL